MGLFGRSKAKLAKDPVCGMEIDPLKAKATTTHNGEAYYFCSAACADRFQAHPARFAK